MAWCWPLLQQRRGLWVLPEPGSPAVFGAVRRYDIHTGVDLYCRLHENVFAVEAGTVVNIEPFTGPHADSPWWFNTWAVLVEGRSGVVVYGELSGKLTLEVGSAILPGSYIGMVERVQPIHKGRHSSMLHLELLLPGTRKTFWWKHEKPQPKRLLDPTQLLKTAISGG